MTGSPAQRELPQKEPPISLYLSSSPAQRELRPHKEPRSSLLRAAPRSGSSLRKSLLLPSYGKPRAAGDFPNSSRASSLVPPSFYRAAPRSGSSPRKISLLHPSLYTMPPTYRRYTWQYNRRGRPPPFGTIDERPQPMGTVDGRPPPVGIQ